MQAEQGSLQENQELTERSKLSIPERVKQLRTEFAGKDIKFTAFHVEGGFIPIDRPEMFPQKPTYIEVDGELKNGSQTEPVRLITPRDLTDANVQFRLMQWAIALRAIDESADDLGAQELLSHFRLPKVIEFHPVDFVKKGTAIGSMMIERVWGKPAGGVHLADPDTFETNDLSRMAGFFDLIRRIGRKHDLTLGEDLYHSHISDRFSDPENNKWWIDFGPRMKFYNEIFGPDFSLAMYKLLISKRTAALFDEKHRNGRELVWGNPIPVNMVITSDQKIGITSMERTAYTYYRAFQEAKFLSAQVGNEQHFAHFMRSSIEQNGTELFFRHLQGSFLNDNLINLEAILKALKDARQAGSREQTAFLEKASANFKIQAEDALYQRNLWDPSQYNLK